MLAFRGAGAEQFLSANNYAALTEGVLKEGLERGHITEDDRRAYLEAWSQPGALTGGLNYYRAARVGPPSGDPEVNPNKLTVSFPDTIVKVPTLVIWGEKDRYLLSSNLLGLEEYVANLTVRHIPLGTHWVIREKPDVINSHIRDFVGGR